MNQQSGKFNRTDALPSASRPARWSKHALERLHERAPGESAEPNRLWQGARFWGHRKTSYVWEAPGDLVLLSVPEAGRWVIVSVMPRKWFEHQSARMV